MLRFVSSLVARLASVSLAFVLAGVLLATVPGTAAARSLRVESGSYAHPGGHLMVTLSLKRNARSKRGALAVVLSVDRRRSRRDIVLKRGVKPPSRHHRRRSLRLKLAAKMRAANFRVLVCRKRSCQAGGRVRVTDQPVGTRELTERAVAKHRLALSRSYVYRLWATLGNPRLPRAYRGDIDAADPGAMIEALAAEETMRPSDRRQIARFLLPPTAWVGAKGKARASGAARVSAIAAPSATASRGSTGYTTCEQQATTEHWSVLTGKYVRIWWWREHGANRKAAAGLVRAADNTIWDAYRKLMGVTPPSDAGRKCDGGDGHYDIYLLPKSVIPNTSTFRAVTLPYAPPCSGSPAFTEFNTHGGGDPPTRFELAHEIFHAFQFAFPIQGDCAAEKEHNWFDEASAVWASTWLYPHEEAPHERAPDDVTNWVRLADCSLDSFDYGAFAFALDIQKRHGLGTIPAIYRAYAKAATSLEGIDAVLPGRFAKAWRQFESDALNSPATGRMLHRWYGMNSRPLPPNSAACSGGEKQRLGLAKGEHAHRIAWDLSRSKSLTTLYDDLTFKPEVKQIRILNHTVGDQRSDLQAFIHMKSGKWQTKDLSDKPDTTYCLADQGIDRIVLAIGDHSIDDSSTKTPWGLIPKSSGPPETYETTLMMDLRDSCANFFKVTAMSGNLDYTADYTTGNPVSCTVSGSEHKTASIDPNGHLDATDGSYESGSFVLNLPVLWSGSLDYSGSGVGCPTPPSCHFDISEPGGPIATAIGEDDAESLDTQIVAPAPDLLSGCAGWFNDSYWSGDVKLITTPVPTATLTSAKPFTLTWQASASGAGRSTSRKLTASVVPTDESGKPRKDSKILRGRLE